MASEYINCDRVKFHPGDHINGKFLVEKSLGEGTFGEVYKVRFEHKFYALKLLKLWEVLVAERAGLLKRFDREFETGKITSSYLVHSVEKGMVKGNPYILMEYCAGGDLLSAAEKENLNFSLIAIDILCGLKDLHKCGKIHRDLKPENVLLKADGHAVLTDFGIAGDQNNRMSRTDLFGNLLERFGTYAYMPPEQINPPRKNRSATVLPTSDIFSFGVMMYQMLTFELPFGDLMSEKDLPRYTSNGKSGNWNKELLLKTSPQWFNVIEGCLRPKIEDRLQSVDEVLTLIPQANKHKPKINPEPQYKVVHGTLLRVMEGEEFGNTFKLDERIKNNLGVITVGRKDSDVYNDIRITENESAYISRCHCTIEIDYSIGKWLIRDGQSRVDCPIAKRSKELYPCPTCTHCAKPKRLTWHRSMNGTYVNSKEVDEKGIYFTPGDIISIGDVKLRVEGY